MAAFRWRSWLRRAPSDSRSAVRPSSWRRIPGLECLEDRCVPSAGAEALARLPLSFEANVGQADSSIRYLAHGNQSDALTLQLFGAATPTLTGLNPQSGVANYLIGNDPTKWHTDVP